MLPIRHTKRRVMAALGCAVALAACSKQTLDYHNTQIVNGKIYAGDANEPFSGHLTNVPSSVVFSGQQGFRTAVATLEKTLPTLTLEYVRASGIDYFPSDERIPVPVYCDSAVSKGYLDGTVSCKIANTENVVLSMTFANGALDGEFSAQAPDDISRLFTKLTFRDGRADGRMEAYSPSTHRLVHTLTWSNGVLNGDEESFDENTGSRVLHASLVDGKYEREMTAYAPDGRQVIYRVSYTNGIKQGAEEAFDPQTGKPAGSATYVDGKLDGTVKRWDAAGKLIYQKDYKDGQEIPDSNAVVSCVDRKHTAFSTSVNDANVNGAMSDAWEAECKEDSASNAAVSTATVRPSANTTPDNLDACVSVWTTAYRRENGDDSIVTADQLGEWHSWCEVGKRPDQ